ncbi:MAG: M16 family metallopeptidase [Candidatus Hodarchaeota archaeon]
MFHSVIRSYPNLRTCTLGIVTYRGAAHDSIAGATQVLLQTMVRGTKNYNELEIAKMIDGTGGSLFSTTEKDFAIIGAQIQPNYAVRTLDLLFDTISAPKLDPEHFNIEKEKLLQTYHQIQSNSLRRMITFEADKAIFGENHPLGRSQIGTPESLAQLSIDEIKLTQKELLIKPWGFAIGNIPKPLQTKLKQKFDEFITGSIPSNIKKTPFPKRQIPPKHIIASLAKDDANAYLCLNIVTKADPKLIRVIRFSSAVLGESYGSRMYTILRDQKAFGYINGSALKLLDDLLILRCFMETSPSRTEEALDTLSEIILSLGKEEISKEEHDTTRDFLLGQLDLSFDNSRQIASRIINRVVHGLSPKIEIEYDQIKKVTSKEIFSIWRKFISPEKFSLAAIGNIDPMKIEKKWQNLTLNFN